MGTQVIGRPICNPNTLNPAKGRFYLRIPAISSIVGHLIWQMLPEAQPIFVNSKACKEKEHPPNEITKSLIVDGSLIKWLRE